MQKGCIHYSSSFRWWSTRQRFNFPIALPTFVCVFRTYATTCFFFFLVFYFIFTYKKRRYANGPFSAKLLQTLQPLRSYIYRFKGGESHFVWSLLNPMCIIRMYTWPIFHIQLIPARAYARTVCHWLWWLRGLVRRLHAVEHTHNVIPRRIIQQTQSRRIIITDPHFFISILSTNPLFRALLMSCHTVLRSSNCT